MGWAIGPEGTSAAAIAHTVDGRLPWESQGDSPAWTSMSGNDISAADDQTAWTALGSTGGAESVAILHTADGEATWVAQTNPTGLAVGIKAVKVLNRGEPEPPRWAA